MPRPLAFSADTLKTLSEPLFELRMKVRFQDVDAAGTVFFPRVIEYFANAYMALLEAGGVDLPDVITKADWVAPIVHAEADYFLPLRYGDAIAVEVAGAALGSTSLTVGYRITAQADRTRIHAIGQTVHVFVDGKTFRPRPVPDAVRAAAETKA
jgi:YbgC/YbaW family acyl-CoA thioester hydrolase